MTNGEYLNNMNMYDLLMKINNSNDIDECVLLYLTNQKYRHDRCVKETGCSECLQNFLNEEKVIK